ncbi:hypothetical protein ACQ10H_16365, partial [Enterococcus faecalis]
AVTNAPEGILYKKDGQIAVMVWQKLYTMRERTEIEIMSLEEKESRKTNSDKQKEPFVIEFFF